MLTTRIFALFAFLSLLTTSTFAQATKPPLDKALEQKSVNLLREIIGDIKDLKSPVNRFYFSSEAASMLWKYDEKQSRQIFEGLMAQTRGQINEILEDMKKPGALIELEEDEDYNDEYAANRPKSRPDNQIVQRVRLNYELALKFYTVNQMRGKLLSALVANDPWAGYGFHKDTKDSFAAPVKYFLRYPGFPYSPYNDIHNFEAVFAESLIKRKENGKAVTIARDLITYGYTAELFNVLKKVVAIDPENGRLIANEILTALLEPDSKKPELLFVDAFFEMAVKSKIENPKSPLLEDIRLSELARFLGQSVLNRQAPISQSRALFYAKTIDKYAPVEAQKIRRAFAKKKVDSADGSDLRNQYYGLNAVERAVYAANAAANAANAAAYAVANAVKTVANTKPPNASKRKTKSEPKQLTVITRKSSWELRREKLEVLRQSVKAGNLSPDDRTKLVTECRKYALSESLLGYYRYDGSTSIVGRLVEFAIAATDNDLSDQLLNEAATFADPNLVNMANYGSKLLLAIGYSARHPNKSFAYLESMTPINDVIAGSVKLGEFIDIQGEMMSFGEVNFGAFPINSMIMGTGSRYYGTRPVDMIQNLAKADFSRTKALADKFERPEFRLTAKMTIVLSILRREDFDNLEYGP